MTTKNEHPALFTAPMVRAIGTGQKTQTRRTNPDLSPQEVRDQLATLHPCRARQRSQRSIEALQVLWSGRLDELRPDLPTQLVILRSPPAQTPHPKRHHEAGGQVDCPALVIFVGDVVEVHHDEVA